MRRRTLEEKIQSLPTGLLKTYTRAALVAKDRVMENSSDQIETIFQYRIKKVFELIEKIIDQYIFLDSRPEKSDWRHRALSEAEEATCEAVRYLLRGYY